VTGLAIVAAVVVLAAFISRRDDAIPVRTALVARGQIRSLISTNGKIEPVQNFEAHAPVTTTVQRVLIKEGDFVKKGKLLVALDDAGGRAQAARAQTQLKAALAEVSAIERGGTQEEVLSLEAQMVKARTDREAAQRNLEALRRLEQQGAASAGEVRAAENALAQADAQLNLLQQKQTRRYSKPEVARSLYEKLITVDKVDLIQGPYATAPILAAMGVAQRYGKVMIQSSMGIPKLQTYDRAFPATPFGPEPNITYPNVILDAMATFPTPPKSMVVLTSKFPSAQFMALGMKEQAEKRSVKVPLYLEYESGNRDFGAIASRMTLG